MCVIIVALTGLAIGWRADASIPSIIGGFAIALFFSYSLSWASACFGLNSKGPESAAVAWVHLLVPAGLHLQLAWCPPRACPGWLQAIADWNPVSAVTAAARHLFGNPNPSASVHAWPMQHPVEAALLWSIAILAVCAPLAAYFFKVRTAE